MSGRDHLLRASTYHRTAEYYAEGDPVALAESGRRSRACFEAAAASSIRPSSLSRVAFEGGFLPGYLVRPARGTHRPTGPARGTLVAFGGFDSGSEEMYFQLGAPGADRGWNVVLFDGPASRAACAGTRP